MTNRYTLYGAEISYFTGKVRAYLRWKGLPHDEVPADAQVYREVILPRVGFPVIPVVVTPAGETLQDSTDIIDALEHRHPGPPVYPPGPVQHLASLLLELYGDEWLVIPAMHYRWHHNREWAMQGFGELNAPAAAPDEQRRIGAKLAQPFAQAAVLLGAEPSMHAAVEASYEALLGELDRHFARHSHLLGTGPSIGDFGLVGPLYAHQYRDPASGELMKRLAPRVARWVECMQRPGPPPPASGAFLPGDEIPDTLLPVLRRMMREQMPVLEDSARRVAARMAGHPGEPLPRTLGMHAFELEGCQGQRIVRPYSLWMLQRARDAYRALAPADRGRADALLARIGGERFAHFDDPPRLRRDGLSVAPAA
ncbi:glutathione S-transferase N-terminal domain-containing protein [Schlegelella sp. S2-27]|uniref:Glutathione S-transferase N-terminal domain-containing protein n=1 Tax=Caldimonas mangrovi TaxID=2944811 RepID=A0ABT0YU09_9BURK|nr:glutathione S-transferase family protein [Caldimonas mangrovi]MCM5682211.1 glutathione S-transferase N-terminal domain-containing protein [Caldimonas mangrovi]